MFERKSLAHCLSFCALRASCFRSFFLSCHMQKSCLCFPVVFNYKGLTSKYIVVSAKSRDFGKTNIWFWGRSIYWSSTLCKNRDLQHHCRLTLHPSPSVDDFYTSYNLFSDWWIVGHRDSVHLSTLKDSNPHILPSGRGPSCRVLDWPTWEHKPFW